MRIGTLNRQMLLQRRVETPTGSGGKEISWVDVATVWASVRYLNGTEMLKSDIPVGSATASIRIRFREDIDATCRAVYKPGDNQTVYEIKAALPDMVGREFVDLAVEVGASNG